MFRKALLFFSCAFFSLPLLAQQDSPLPEPPKAPEIPTVLILHGDTLKDEFSWLRNRNDPKVINYLSAENAFTKRLMKDSEWFQTKLYEEMRARTFEDEQSLPVKIDSFYYYSRYERSQQYPAYYRKKDSMQTKELPVLDLNKLAADGGFLQLAGYWVSPDQQMLAYGLDFSGNRKATIFFKHLKTGTTDSIRLEDVGSLAWANDSKTLFYTTLDSTFRSNKLYRYQLGADPSSRELIYEETDSTFSIGLGKTASKEYITITSFGGSNETSEVRLLPANEPQQAPLLFLARQKKHRYHVGHLQDTFFIETNRGNRNGSVSFITSLEERALADWQTYIPASDSVMIGRVIQFEKFYVVMERQQGQQQLRIHNKQTGQSHYIRFDEPAYSIWLGSNSDPAAEVLQFGYSSFTKPATTYAYHMESRQTTVLKQQKVRGGYQANKYVSERLHAKAPDGTLVPISLVYRKDLKKDGQNPTLLMGYGAYGMTNDPYFSSARLSLLDRGFVFAVAHVRGGGEGGYQWHDGGKMFHKKNTFTDFIAASELLIEKGYTSPKKLVIEGGSAGGLLIGAVINQRPELYQAAILHVPFVDVINSMLDEKLPLTTFEFEEWGNPKVKEQYQYMRSYSPYENIKKQDYPHLLLQGGFNDSQVGYWEPAKFAARLRKLKTDENLLLLNISMGGGHGLTSGRYNHLQQQAFEYAFLFKVLGIEEDYGVFRGRVLDPNGDPMPFVTIWLPEQKTGSTTNQDGEFVLELRRGNHPVVFRYLGFETQTIAVTPQNMNDYREIKLKTEDDFMEAVVVTADKVDPAYAIIKSAIAKRKQHLNQLEGYSNQTYIKNITRLVKIPEKWPAFLPKNSRPDSTDLGIIYLSESVSDYHFQQPDKYKEVMLSSKVSGLSQGFSWNRATDVLLNFYENRVNVAGMAPRGLISPLAENAFFYYHYEYEGVKEEGGSKITKIKVIPRRKNDPVFQGHVYIVEDEWSLSGVDLMLTKNQIELFDSLKVQQDYQLVGAEIRMPVSLHISADIKIFGIGASAHSYIFYSNYKINPSFSSRFFGNEVFRVEEGANKKEATYWDNRRPLMLTEEERQDYAKGDSLEVKRNSKVYLDSLDVVYNKFSIMEAILTGHNWSNRWKKRYFSTMPLLEVAQYNTVEGWNFTLGSTYTQYFDKSWRHYKLGATLRYGLGSEKLYGKLDYSYFYNTHRHAYLEGSVGHYVSHFDEQTPISALVNTSYTLKGKANYMKLYQKSYLELRHRSEIANGIYLNAEVAWEDRTPLFNTRDFTGSEGDNPDFTSNNPLKPHAVDEPAFERHQALKLGVGLRFRYKQRYENDPRAKLIIGSKYPTLHVQYQKGIKGLFGSDVDFDILSASLYDDISFALLGKSRWAIKAGGVLQKDEMPFPDWQHFSGNRTLFSNRNDGNIMRYHLLDYYTFSTNRHYLQGHYEHHFNGFLINKIPLLRKTKFQVVSGANYLRTAELGNYYEGFIGIENILKVIRIDWANAWNDQLNLRSGIRVGVKLQ